MNTPATAEEPMSHRYKQVQKAGKKPIPTVREMVTKWGDIWAAMMPSEAGYYMHQTDDFRDYINMKYMEKGEWPRIRTEDLYGE